MARCAHAPARYLEGTASIALHPWLANRVAGIPMFHQALLGRCVPGNTSLRIYDIQ